MVNKRGSIFPVQLLGGVILFFWTISSSFWADIFFPWNCWWVLHHLDLSWELDKKFPGSQHFSWKGTVGMSRAIPPYQLLKQPSNPSVSHVPICHSYHDLISLGITCESKTCITCESKIELVNQHEIATFLHVLHATISEISKPSPEKKFPPPWGRPHLCSSKAAALAGWI